MYSINYWNINRYLPLACIIVNNNGDDEEDDHDGGVGGLGAVNVTQPTPSTSPTTPSGAATVLHSAPLMMALMGLLISYTMMSFILGA